MVLIKILNYVKLSFKKLIDGKAGVIKVIAILSNLLE